MAWRFDRTRLFHTTGRIRNFRTFTYVKLNYVYCLWLILGLVQVPGITKAQDTLQGLLPLRNMEVVYDTIIVTHSPQQHLLEKGKAWLRDHHYTLTDSSVSMVQGSSYLYISWNPTVVEDDPVQVMHTLQFAFIDGQCRIRITFTDAKIIKAGGSSTESLLQFATEHNTHPSLVMLNDRARIVLRDGALAMLSVQSP